MTIEGQKAVMFTVNMDGMRMDSGGESTTLKFSGGELRLDDKATIYKLKSRISESRRKHCGQFRIMLQTRLRAKQWRQRKEKPKETSSRPETGSLVEQLATNTRF